MPNSIEGKRAIVTGGTRGIGYAIAESLLSAGVSVAICGRSKDGVVDATDRLAAKGRVVGRAVDVANPSDVSTFFELVDSEFGGIDILVNNAGVGIFRSVAELSIEEWKTLLDVNLSGVFYCSREALARMRNSEGGFIVNISSLAGKNPFAGGGAYNASKFGLNGFSEAMMLDHRQDNVRVSYVMPGSVDTDFSPRSERASWKIAPEDVAEIVLHILTMPARTLISRVEVRPSRPPK